MQRNDFWRRVVKLLLRRHGDVKSFDHETRAAGGVAGSVDTGIRVVPTNKVVGSVSRWRNLRSDFFYKSGRAITERFIRVGQAMQQGKALPPLELYKIKLRRQGATATTEVSEYYVVDGHHRVAMARKLGQDFLDARVVEYKLAGTNASQRPDQQTEPRAEQPPAEAATSPPEPVPPEPPTKDGETGAS